jgi:serine/threonine-protein kinase
MVKCEHCGGAHDDGLRFCPVTGKLAAPGRFFPAGTVIDGKYRIDGILGTGGMGVVLEATHLLLSKKVAVKLLHPGAEEDPEMTTRLMREARAASAVEHRNVVAVVDVGATREGTVYFVMERLTGRPLSRIIKEEAPLDPRRAAHLISGVLAGLEAVHRKTIIHRDLKPSNIMVATEVDGAEVPKVFDFGISKILEEKLPSPLTTVGRVLGTPLYMSPEQARGTTDVDARADLYACGAILYAMLTGAPPFSASNYNALVAAILHGNPTPPSGTVSSIPASLDAIVLKAMALRREERFPDAASFRRALAPLLADPTDGTLPGPRPVPSSEAMMMMREPQDEMPEAVPLGAARSAIARRGPAKGEVEPATAPRRQDPRDYAPPEVQEEPLELAEPLPSGPAPLGSGGRVPAVFAPERGTGAEIGPPGTLYTPPRRGLSTHAIRRGLMLLGAVGALLVGWHYREIWQGMWTGTPSVESVYVLVETEPRDAEVYVDGVLQVTKPVSLPKSPDRTFIIRVKAKGYLTETREVLADQTRSLRISLRPSRKSPL